MSGDYWLDEPAPAPGVPPALASDMVGRAVYVVDAESGVVYGGQLTGYDYDTRTATVALDAERLLGDDEWFPTGARSAQVRCGLTDITPS